MIKHLNAFPMVAMIYQFQIEDIIDIRALSVVSAAAAAVFVRSTAHFRLADFKLRKMKTGPCCAPRRGAPGLDNSEIIYFL